MEVFLGSLFHDGWFLFALGSLILLRNSVALLLALGAHANIPLDISVSFQRKKYFMIK